MRMIVFIAVVLGTTACQKTRADYRDDVANAVCAEMKKCGKVGEGEKFANLDDCRTELKSRYNKQWSAEACEGRIDPEAFSVCKKKAVTNACEGNLLDRVSFSFQCGADDVCIAPDASAK